MAQLIKIRDSEHQAEVRGLKELQRELRLADPEMAKRLQKVNKRLVDDIASEARAVAYHRVDEVSPSIRTGPARTRPSGKGSISRSVNSIRGSASGREARIVAGGARAPGFFGHEFGGSRNIGGLGRRAVTGAIGAVNRGTVSGRGGVRNRTRQFPVHKGKEGYFLYPTVREELPHAAERWENLFDEIFREGPR